MKLVLVAVVAIAAVALAAPQRPAAGAPLPAAGAPLPAAGAPLPAAGAPLPVAGAPLPAAGAPLRPVSQAQAQAQNEPPKILRSKFEQQPEGAYVYSFETENGITRQENGEVKEVLDEENKPIDVIIVRGSYSYTDSDGNPQTVTYYADETGFHAEGDAIPKVPAARR